MSCCFFLSIFIKLKWVLESLKFGKKNIIFSWAFFGLHLAQLHQAIALLLQIEQTIGVDQIHALDTVSLVDEVLLGAIGEICQRIVQASVVHWRRRWRGQILFSPELVEDSREQSRARIVNEQAPRRLVVPVEYGLRANRAVAAGCDQHVRSTLHALLGDKIGQRAAAVHGHAHIELANEVV